MSIKYFIFGFYQIDNPSLQSTTLKLKKTKISGYILCRKFYLFGGKLFFILLVITILVCVLIIPETGLFKQLNMVGGKSPNSWHKNPEYKNNGDAENIILLLLY